MNTRSFLLMLATAVALTGGTGCQLVASVERDDIPAGGDGDGEGAGGAGGSGGKGGTMGAGGGKGGTTGGSGAAGNAGSATGGTSGSAGSSTGGGKGGSGGATAGGGNAGIAGSAGASGMAGVAGATTGGGTSGSAGSTAGGGNAGSTGASGGSGGASGAAGGCGTPCTLPGECPDPGNECVARTCEAGCCGTAPVDDLKPTVDGQKDKNCQVQVCDGNGATKLVADVDDRPDATDACHVGACEGNTPEQQPVTTGTVCAFDGGKVCDGKGACVACVGNGDCNAGALETCVSNTCIAAGCSDMVQNDTETDKDCGGSCLRCDDGLKCKLGDDCKSDVCTGDVCQVPTCSDGKKNGGETDIDCGGGCASAPTSKACGFGEGCASAADCSTGSCNGVTCAYKSQGAVCGSHDECGASGSNLCVDGFCCNTDCTDGCRACSAAKKGTGGDGICGDIAVGTDPNKACDDEGASSCGNDGECDGSGACRKRAAGTTCRTSAGFCDVQETCPGGGAPCPSNGFLGAGTMCRVSAGPCDLQETCSGSSADCPADTFASSSTVCRPAPDACDVAETCSGSTADCPADGVAAVTKECRTAMGACDVAESCDGSNKACPPDGFAPSTTVCRPAADASCDLPESCTGSGASCPADQFASDVVDCGSTCASGQQTLKLCDGSGTCSTGSPTSCANGCNSTSTLCETPCAGDGNCASGNYCKSGSCEPKVASGSACSASNACSSGICDVDGSGNCCAVACTTSGTCGATSCSSSGACVGPGSGTGCGSSCSGGTLTTSACNGSGSCVAGSPAPCPDGLSCADATSCKVTCTGDTDCASSNDYCSGGVCVPKGGNGALCASNNSCTSGVCDVDGTGNCCATACVIGGDCGASSCNGSGACQYPSQGVCNEACSGSTLTLSTCNGAGDCLSGTPAPCPGGLICESATECKSPCVTDTDCASSSDYCAGGPCLPKLAVGQSCPRNSACVSDVCGVAGNGSCCSSTCNTSGVCGATHCNAQGACIGPDGNTPCGSSCSGGMLTKSSCDGATACVPGTPEACGMGLICADATSCKTSCSVDSDCVSTGDHCSSGGGGCDPDQPDGDGCSANNECSSGVCAAYCCTGPCSTVCEQGTGACRPAPTVVSTSPAGGSTPAATTSLVITFSTDMTAATLTAQTGLGACSGSIQVSVDDFATCVAFASAAPTMSGGTYNATIATLRPQPGLLVNRSYKIRVTTAAKDIFGAAFAADYTSLSFTTTSPVTTGASGVVISQIYNAGGSAGSAYKNDFIELHNRGTTAVDLTGWSVQYSTGGAWSVTNLTSVMLQPGAFYLVQEAGGTEGASLPTPDATGTIAMAGTARVALLNTTTTLAFSSCPSGAQLVDLVGYGQAGVCREGTGRAPLAFPNPLSSSVTRVAGGCRDTGDNASDFGSYPANPRNTASTAMPCAPAQNESGVALEADFCSTRFPLTLNVAAGASQTVYGRIYEAGTTTLGVNPPAGVTAELGYGPTTANPEYEWGWIWANATHNAQCVDANPVGSQSLCGNDDEFQATFTAPAAGAYRYAFRFSLDGGASWTYCDEAAGDGGAGSNGVLTFDLSRLAPMSTF
jgi:hypothetical protein